MWNMFGACVGHDMFGSCSEHVWRDVWGTFGACLGHVWPVVETSLLDASKTR